MKKRGVLDPAVFMPLLVSKMCVLLVKCGDVHAKACRDVTFFVLK